MSNTSASCCKDDSDPCNELKNSISVSQVEAVNIAQQLAIMRALILKIIDRIPIGDKRNLASKRFATSEATTVSVVT